MLRTPPGTSEVAKHSASVIATKGHRWEAISTTTLPAHNAGARRPTSPASAGSSGATTPDTPIGSGTVRLKYGPATGLSPPVTCEILSVHPAYQTHRSMALSTWAAAVSGPSAR